MESALLALETPLTETADLVDVFLRGLPETTFNAYHSDLRYFSNFTRLPNINTAIHVLISNGQGSANRLAHEYRADMLESGLTPNTINRRLSTLRSLCKRLRTFGVIEWSLSIENVKRQVYRDTRGPQESGYRQIVEASNSRHDVKGIRDRVIVRLLHDVALRRAEVVNLDVSDIDQFNRTVGVRGKGRLEKQAIRLPDKTWNAIAEWLDVRGNHPGPLFYNLHRGNIAPGKRLTATSVYRIIQALGKETGQKVTPHGLRHTAITTAVERATENNIDLSKVLQFSRHANLATLQIYADRHADWQGRVADLVAE